MSAGVPAATDFMDGVNEAGNVTDAYKRAQGSCVAHRIHALWMHEYVDTTGTVQARFSAPNAPVFTVAGTDLGRDWAVLGYGIDLIPSSHLQVSFSYDSQLNEHQVFHIGTAGVQVLW